VPLINILILLEYYRQVGLRVDRKPGWEPGRGRREQNARKRERAEIKAEGYLLSLNLCGCHFRNLVNKGKCCNFIV
jgi:hypothetical protein